MGVARRAQDLRLRGARPGHDVVGITEDALPVVCCFLWAISASVRTIWPGADSAVSSEQRVYRNGNARRVLHARSPKQALGFLAWLLVMPAWQAGAGTGMAMMEPESPLDAEQTCGALLREDFNGDTWGASWSPWIQDNNVQVVCRDGKLEITGVTGDPAPECRDHHEFRFVGLVSKRFPKRDVVLACDMQVLAPLPEGNVRVRFLAHLCGARPDYFVDTGLAHEPDGREGWLHVPIAEGYPVSHDHQWPFVSLDRISAEGPHTMAIDHDPASKRTRGYVVDGDRWHLLGKPRVFLATTQVEIKVDVPYDGVRVGVAYDNVRLYPRPETTPVWFILVRPPFPGYPFRGAKVVFRDGAGSVVGQGKTDGDGEAEVKLPSDRLYPLGGRVEIVFEGKPVGTAPILASGVDGLYPGDVWKIRAPDLYKVNGGGYPHGM